MSLWGKNDNKLSDGTVTVNHANRTVIGSGTTFGSVGCGCLLYTSDAADE